ncbi:hypothetical protein QBC45DRAFT_421133 [Copromyces sp. CBS 386.78]|nr:hypothetical protein QBC45DRAFT_421133 [Copromyces sp. CBS 386.78]
MLLLLFTRLVVGLGNHGCPSFGYLGCQSARYHPHLKVPRLWFPSGRRRCGKSHVLLTKSGHSTLKIRWVLEGSGPGTVVPSSNNSKPVGLGAVIAVHPPPFGPSRVS